MRVLLEIFGQTLRTLWAHKLRSFLTMFGIAWGVGSLLLLVGVGEGFRSGNRKQFDAIGENVLFIFSGRAPAVEGSFTSMRQYYLTYQDYLDVKALCPDVKQAAPLISRSDLRSVSDYFQSSGQVLGAPANLTEIRYLPIHDGRWINDLDDAQKRSVVVLGDEARRLLFAGRPAVGSTILIGGIRFEVIGTLKRIGHGDDNFLNMRMFVPFQTLHEYFPLTVDVQNAISFINYQPTSRAEHEAAKLEVHKVIATITVSTTGTWSRLMNGTPLNPSIKSARSSTP
jgi:putative ABC transport system permease protein